jgi:hypothetical protein
MKLKLLILFLLMSMVACTKERKTIFPNVVKIIEVQTIPDVKSGFDVVINKRLNPIELESLGRDLYHEYDGKKYENFFVNYYLERMIIGNGSYASTHFTPNLEVEITGLPTEQVTRLEEKSLEKKPYYIDDGWKCLTTMKNENGKISIHRVFIDPTTDEMTTDNWSLKRVVKDKDTIYQRTKSETGEYFRYSSDGDLEWYDKQGLIDKLLKG